MTKSSDQVDHDVLKAKVDQLTAEGRVRNSEGERIALLADATVTEEIRTVIKDVSGSPESTLVLMSDNSVRWEDVHDPT